MTEDLVQQKDRTVQAERVAAWRELARRLAHELKNPLFPLQVTVENLIRAKQKSPEMFEEVFREGTATLLAEIDNLKTIIGRFSEFSRMPQPQRQPTQMNDVVRSVLSVFPRAIAGENGQIVHCTPTWLRRCPKFQPIPICCIVRCRIWCSTASTPCPKAES
jgi:two-component system nitrogen regulation sensor histidine kinase NtrY